MAERPAFLLVIAKVHDPARMGAYAKALAESGLYARYGGHYEFIGRAVADMEGWDMAQAVVCARFPSRAAATAFWNDAQYQTEVKPFRIGAADVMVGLFDAADTVTGGIPDA